MKKLPLILIALLMTVAASAQTNTDKIVAEIMRLEAEYVEASKNPRLADFERFYTADFLVTFKLPPKVLNNEQRIAAFKDPKTKRGTVESLVNDDVKVRVYGGDTAIVTGHWTRVSRSADGKDTSASGRFTHVWVNQSGRWLLASAHYSPDVDLEKLKAAQTETRKN